jgi:hypothetical protein
LHVLAELFSDEVAVRVFVDGMQLWEIIVVVIDLVAMYARRGGRRARSLT